MTGKRRSSRRSWLAGAVAALACGAPAAHAAEAAAGETRGGIYDNARDRDTASLVVGLNF